MGLRLNPTELSIGGLGLRVIFNMMLWLDLDWDWNNLVSCDWDWYRIILDWIYVSWDLDWDVSYWVLIGIDTKNNVGVHTWIETEHVLGLGFIAKTVNYEGKLTYFDQMDRKSLQKSHLWMQI